jgi:hypothetical protein
MEEVSSNGTMVINLMANSMRTIFMERVHIPGKTDADTTATGIKTKCMVMAFSHGLMDENMRASMLTTTSKAKVCSSGRMDVLTTDPGSLAKWMVRVHTLRRKAAFVLASGKKARGNNGSRAEPLKAITTKP